MMNLSSRLGWRTAANLAEFGLAVFFIGLGFGLGVWYAQ